MTFANFIPKIWNAQLQLALREKAIAANLVNRDYEGDATKGNTVRVSTATAVAVKNYKTGVKLDSSSNPIARTTVPDDVDTTYVDLLIDQERSFDFRVQDIDKTQAAGGIDKFAESAALGLAEDADKFILASISGSVTHLTASSISTGDAAWNIIRDLRKALNKSKVPQAQRVVVVNAEFEAILLDAASKITNVDRSGDPAGLREAALGRILGFDVYTSENLPVVSKPQAISWFKPAFSFVNQITETEAMRDNDTISDRIRGLNVYGAKQTAAAGIACWTAS